MAKLITYKFVHLPNIDEDETGTELAECPNPNTGVEADDVALAVEALAPNANIAVLAVVVAWVPPKANAAEEAELAEVDFWVAPNANAADGAELVAAVA